MTEKTKSPRNEHYSIKLLDAAGHARTHAAASLGAGDITGIGSTDVMLIQVRTRDWPSAAEMKKLWLSAAPAICRKLLHRDAIFSEHLVSGSRVPERCNKKGESAGP
jgi:hypothetical protein